MNPAAGTPGVKDHGVFNRLPARHCLPADEEVSTPIGREPAAGHHEEDKRNEEDGDTEDHNDAPQAPGLFRDRILPRPLHLGLEVGRRRDLALELRWRWGSVPDLAVRRGSLQGLRRFLKGLQLILCVLDREDNADLTSRRRRSRRFLHPDKNGRGKTPRRRRSLRQVSRHRPTPLRSDPPCGKREGAGRSPTKSEAQWRWPKINSWLGATTVQGSLSLLILL